MLHRDFRITFYHSNFTISLFFHQKGGITGDFFIKRLEIKKYSFKGIYKFINKSKLELSFIVEWNFLNMVNTSLTAFSGYIEFIDNSKESLYLKWLFFQQRNNLNINTSNYSRDGNLLLQSTLEAIDGIAELEKLPFIPYFEEEAMSLN